MEQTVRSLDRLAYAHDASHYLLVPEAVVTPQDAAGVARAFASARAAGRCVSFRSGGTSLSGQGVTSGVMLDTRKHFRRIEILQGGEEVRVGPGATVRHVNTRLARHGRKLGPDPASEIACTIGGVIANNSSGMACGTVENSYRTVTGLVLVLPSGTVIDTGAPGADAELARLEPGIHRGLAELRDELRADPALVAEVRRQYAIKNTMGYGLNSLLDHDEPVRILEHLVIGSEGTLAFTAEARFRTIEVRPRIATALLVFASLAEAMAALPGLVDLGLATVELMDARSLRVAQGLADVPGDIARIDVDCHAALLVEVHAADEEGLLEGERAVADHLAGLPLALPARLTRDDAERAALWSVRKGLYTAVAEARPSGTTALLEDIAVPVDRLLAACEGLERLFDAHRYEGTVIFGHAKDGNVHFMVNEDFRAAGARERYRVFTDELVDLVLGLGGTLKAEHGTGRVMAPFVRRQFGDRLYGFMQRIKALIDPDGLLAPGVLLSDDPESYLDHLKLPTTVEEEVDRCVECGYCEPVCPSRNLTLTPRQRIVLRRELVRAEANGANALADELREMYRYDGVETCAADGMCAVACPVNINTGDLVRRLRAEDGARVADAAWAGAAEHWGAVTRAGSAALTLADRLPAPLVTGATAVGRAILGAETVPRYDADLPAGGRGAGREPGGDASDGVRHPELVFFAACIGTMFGAASGDPRDGGSAGALLALLRRAGIPAAVPDAVDGLCCGTPWKSKGHLSGYGLMSERVLPALWAASRQGELPIVCDAASCSEGLDVMIAQAASEDPRYRGLRVIDATQFVADRVLPRLAVPRRLGRVAVHTTCSTTQLGANDAVLALAAAVAEEVVVPDGWGCCAFAGDRGMLHPELTASATEDEVAGLARAEREDGAFDAYVSANRTCEIGMTRATGREYRHVLELLAEHAVAR
ncbi:FAD-binding oxidoreductase [Leucobacter sp. CSA1]|uniref:D-lactate dehydrogenase (cytochrome) n=1 Tax=Leucobacter chromiisoli TaxID=2796471 RepID=A0A934Q5L6_9MICO|nr:FAD-binding oxidoreductase [Leucobacter chromiisoli]